jgi:hypothetical protein
LGQRRFNVFKSSTEEEETKMFSSKESKKSKISENSKPDEQIRPERAEIAKK